MKFHEEGILKKKKWWERESRAAAFIPVASPHCAPPHLSPPFPCLPHFCLPCLSTLSFPPLLPSHISQQCPLWSKWELQKWVRGVGLSERFKGAAFIPGFILTLFTKKNTRMGGCRDLGGALGPQTVHCQPLYALNLLKSQHMSLKVHKMLIHDYHTEKYLFYQQEFGEP